MHPHNTFGAAVMTSVITGVIRRRPSGALGYAEKLVSVLILAMVAEVGRRVIALLWRQK